MIARVWQGVVPLEKAEGYGEYLSSSERGIPGYRATPGNRGAFLLRRVEGDRAHFLLVSLWESRESIEAYAGPDIDQARCFPYDRECLVEPERRVTHCEVLVAPEPGGG